MNILLQGRIAVDHLSLLTTLADNEWTLTTWDPAADALADFTELAKSADIIAGGNIPLDTWPAVPNLKLFQIPWAGYNFTSPAQMPAGIPVANCYEHETAIAEYVLLAMLEWQIRLGDMDSRFRREGWGGRLPAGGIFHGEVRGQTVGLIGYGHIGQAIATRAAAFDMQVMAIRRQRQQTPAPLHWLGTPEEIDNLLEHSDYIVLACDLNDATENLINSKTLNKMKDTAVVINIARGEIINEEDLYLALVEKRIGGAVLDVWYHYNQPGEAEVWPCRKPFQDLDNVILSAHESGWTQVQDNRRWQAIADNIRRIADGQAPDNVVFTGTAATA